MFTGEPTFREVCYDPQSRKTNGKYIRSGRAIEERTGQSTAGSPTVYRRAHSFRKLKFKRTEHPIGCRSKENQPRAEGAMAECLEWIAASENYGLDSREAHHIGFSPQENRGGTVGEGESGEENGIKYGARISPLLRWRLFSLGRNHCGLDAR